MHVALVRIGTLVLCLLRVCRLNLLLIGLLRACGLGLLVGLLCVSYLGLLVACSRLPPRYLLADCLAIGRLGLRLRSSLSLSPCLARSFLAHSLHAAALRLRTLPVRLRVCTLGLRGLKRIRDVDARTWAVA